MRIHTVFSLVGCSRVPVIGSASYSELVEMIVPIVHLIRQFGGNLRNLTTNFFTLKSTELSRNFSTSCCGMRRSRRTFKPVEYLSSYIQLYTAVLKYITKKVQLYMYTIIYIRMHTRSRTWSGWHFLQSHNMDSFWKWVYQRSMLTYQSSGSDIDKTYQSFAFY